MDPRDEFAKSALSGMVSDGNNFGRPAVLANWAYQYADSMMEEREKSRVIDLHEHASYNVKSQEDAKNEAERCIIEDIAFHLEYTEAGYTFTVLSEDDLPKPLEERDG
jgi:hypothetical protein